MLCVHQYARISFKLQWCCKGALLVTWQRLQLRAASPAAHGDVSFHKPQQLWVGEDGQTCLARENHARSEPYLPAPGSRPRALLLHSTSDFSTWSMGESCPPLCTRHRREQLRLYSHACFVLSASQLSWQGDRNLSDQNSFLIFPTEKTWLSSIKALFSLPSPLFPCPSNPNEKHVERKSCHCCFPQV